MRLRRAFAFLSAVAVFGAGGALPAAATAVPPPQPVFRPLPIVRATGEFVTALNPNGLSVYFTCAGASAPVAAATIVTECSIYVNGVFQANYPNGASGNVAVSTGRHDGPPGQITLCYKAKAMFTDGSIAESTRGCVSD
ncbi:MAG TPA: hypothetical protein VG318_17145 [Actinomycetota bacterium]|nr:hypothetical protein [Actinomycetota bacterium]